MSRFDPHHPSNRPPATEEPRPTLVTNGGVQVFVREPRAEAYDEPAPEPRRAPDVVIIPAHQPEEDRRAFFAFVERHWGAYIRKELARRKGVAEESVKDLQQQVLIVLDDHYDEQRRAGQPVVPGNARAFLDTVIDHAVCNHVRKKARRPQIEDGAEVDLAADAALDPEETASRAELYEKLARYGAQLTLEEAAVLAARVAQGQSFQEIADALGVPTTTAFHIHERAIAKLRDLARASERGTRLARGRATAPVDSRK